MTTYTAADFARAEFARNRDGRLGARLAGGTHGHEWIIEGFMGAQVSRGDADMASELWAPVRAAHSAATDEDHGVTTSEEDAEFWQARWKEAADRADARDAAARLWKETARHLFGAREVVRLSCDLETGRADRAEQERDQYRAEQPRPLTPEDFQALVQQAGTAIARRVRALDPSGNFQPSALRLADAIYRGIRDSQRPEGAEELDGHVDAAMRGVGLHPLSVEQVRIVADNLADSGVRAQGAES